MGTNCKEEFYCEYECNGRQWALIAENTQKGYYCPVDPPLSVPCREGRIICTGPIPE